MWTCEVGTGWKTQPSEGDPPPRITLPPSKHIILSIYQLSKHSLCPLHTLTLPFNSKSLNLDSSVNTFIHRFQWAINDWKPTQVERHKRLFLEVSATFLQRSRYFLQGSFVKVEKTDKNSIKIPIKEC